MTTLPATLDEMIVDLYWRTRDDQRRARNRKRTGKVVEVDAEKGLARVQLNDGSGDYPPFKTGWLPWREQAMGAMRTHFPPSVGQQVVVQSENGDLTDAEIETSLPSDDVQRPSQSGEEYVLADVGGTRIVATGDGIKITTGTFEVEAGEAKITADTTIDGPTKIEGDELTHNGKNISDDHRHTDVMPGPALTGPPA